MSWLPTVNDGSRLVIGSWKITDISLPRTFRSCARRHAEQLLAVESSGAGDRRVRREESDQGK